MPKKTTHEPEISTDPAGVVPEAGVELTVAAQAPTLQAPTLQAPKTPERVKIMIHAQDGPGGKDDVAVGLNGRITQIKRGKKVSVPMGVYKILLCAIQTDFYLNDTDQVEAAERARFAITKF